MIEAGDKNVRREKILTASWWFEDSSSFQTDGYIRFVEALETHLPEAIPERYGPFEPPQFAFAEWGRVHFLESLRRGLHDGLVWYPASPVSNVFVSIPSPVGGSWQGYRCCRLAIEIQTDVLIRPGELQRVERLWLAVAGAVAPFYAEMRVGTTPVDTWWWTGIPRLLGFAAMIGPPYSELWPEFRRRSTQIAPAHFLLEVFDLHQSLTLMPPEEIAQPAQPSLPNRSVTGEELRAFLTGRRHAYPSTWPFADPFVD